MQSEGYISPNLRPSDSCSPDIEKLLQKAEFENSEQVKLIEAENQRYAALQRQIEEKTRHIEELDKSTKDLDEEAKTLHKHFKQNREICESLKKTNDILNEHEEALQRKNEDLTCKIQRQETQNHQTLEKYQKTWQSYHERYESGKSATELRKTKEKAQKLMEQVTTMDDKIGDLKQGISNIQEMERNEMQQAMDFTSAMPALIRLAELNLDMRQKMSDVDKVNRKIQYTEENRVTSSESIEASNEDNQMACDPPEPRPTTEIELEIQGMLQTEDSAVSTLESIIPPSLIWNNLPPHTINKNPSGSVHETSPATASINQQELTSHGTSLQCQQTSKMPVSSGQYSLRPTGQLINQSNRSAEHVKSPEGFSSTALVSAAKEQATHAMDISTEYNTAASVPDYSPLSHLQVQLTQQVPSNDKEIEITTASPAPQDQPTNSAEHTGVQNPVSPGLSARTLDGAKSPFNITVHTQRIEQLTKSPGEGFLFRGRPMFEVAEGTEEQGKSNEPLPGFFQPFLEANEQRQLTFGNSGSSVSSPSVREESRSSGDSIGFFSGSDASSSKDTMRLFGSPFKGQTSSGMFAEAQSPALFQMFGQTTSEAPPSVSVQQSPSAFSFNFSSSSPRSENSNGRPVFSLF